MRIAIPIATAILVACSSTEHPESLRQANNLQPQQWYPAAGAQPGKYMQMYKQLTDATQGPYEVQELLQLPAFLPNVAVGTWPVAEMVADYPAVLFFAPDAAGDIHEHIFAALCVAGQVCADTLGQDCVGCQNGGTCTTWACGAWHTDFDLTAPAIVSNGHAAFFNASSPDSIQLTVQAAGVGPGFHDFTVTAQDQQNPSLSSNLTVHVSYPGTYGRSDGHYLIATEQENTPTGACNYPASANVTITAVKSATEPSPTNPFSNWPNPVTSYTLSTLPKFSTEDCAQSAIAKRPTPLLTQWQLIQ